MHRRRRVPDKARCAWVGDDPLYIAYHDEEWGRPQRDERHLFEMLNLEGAQAGLSWLTILRKRENYRSAFAGFDPEVVARFDSIERARLLDDAGIVRNRAKIDATIGNAKAWLKLREEEPGGAVAYLWSFVGGAPKVNSWKALAEIPAETAESKAMSQALKAKGFRFVGPTICYAFMQATGMVDDHSADCHLRREA
ncbi:MAG: DNA-3-methyladenine glycosylase I [Rhodovibrionaceae bacterium]